MTTIAYKDGVIARDSRSTDPIGYIISDKEEKMVQRNGITFFCYGNATEIEMLLNAYFGEKADLDVPANIETYVVDVSAFVIEEGKLYTVGMDHKGVFKNKCMRDEIYAFGSGGDIAIGAMEMGASAAEAVEVSKRRDSKTGGEVKTFTLHEEIIQIL